MHRFLVPEDAFQGPHVRMPPEGAWQIARVLRMRPGERVAVFDGSGLEWTVELEQCARQGVTGRVVAERRPDTEPSVSVTLWQGILDPAQFELVLQKVTELGVARVVPLVTERVKGGSSHAPSAKRRERWRRVIQEAAEQSGRTRVPELGEPGTVDEAIGELGDPTLVAWEERGEGLKEAMARTGAASAEAIDLIVGPKGGLTDDEAEAFRHAGAAPISLGRRVLRAETAAIALLAAVMYESGEVG